MNNGTTDDITPEDLLTPQPEIETMPSAAQACLTRLYGAALAVRIEEFIRIWGPKSEQEIGDMRWDIVSLIELRADPLRREAVVKTLTGQKQHIEKLIKTITERGL